MTESSWIAYFIYFSKNRVEDILARPILMSDSKDQKKSNLYFNSHYFFLLLILELQTLMNSWVHEKGD